ncbi:MAG: O-methyltransferase [Actinomycetota bacterium]
MTVQIVDTNVESYIAGLLSLHDEPVLLDMEAEAKEKGFPIVGRHVGVTLTMLAGSIDAKRVFELGSGYGFSAYWFAKVAHEVHCTDGDPGNEQKASEYLSRAGVWDRVRYHVGDAVTALNATTGEYDIVYNDIDKDGYPAAWLAARTRVRVGGLYICDNVLWSGRVAQDDPDDKRPEWTAAIKEHNTLVFSDKAWWTTIIPIRDGVIVARRIR